MTEQELKKVEFEFRDVLGLIDYQAVNHDPQTCWFEDGRQCTPENHLLDADHPEELQEFRDFYQHGEALFKHGFRAVRSEVFSREIGSSVITYCGSPVRNSDLLSPIFWIAVGRTYYYRASIIKVVGC